MNSSHARLNSERYMVIDDRAAVQFERVYAHPLSRVWQAVADPEELRAWFPSSLVFEPVVGGAVTFAGDPNVADADGIVLEYEPPRAFAFTWGDNEIRLHLETAGDDGCRLRLTDKLAAENEAARNAAGWDVCLHGLDRLIEHDEIGNPHGSDIDWPASYAAYVQAGMPSGAPIPSSGS